MLLDLNKVIEEFSMEARNFIELVPSPDPRFICRQGSLDIDRTPLAFIEEGIKELEIYKILYSIISTDGILRTARTKVGSWGKPETIIEEMITRSVVISSGKAEINTGLAKLYIKNLRNTLSLKKLNFTLFRRLLGIDITQDKIQLEPGCFLVRLTEEELNERIPALSNRESGIPHLALMEHPVEIRITIEQKFKGTELEFISPDMESRKKLLYMCDAIYSAIILTKIGIIEPGPYYFELNTAGGKKLFEQTPVNTQFMLPVFSNKIIIDENDIPILKSTYLTTKTICCEETILRSVFKYFISGSGRINPHERLVDYVIAWESLLLTEEGRSIKDGLLYRFVLNGGSVLSRLGLAREEAIDFMRVFFEVYSMVIRGENEKQIQRSLLRAKTSSLPDLLEKSGDYLRKTIIWMSGIPEDERPYKKRGGWESLLFSGVN